MTAVLNPLGVPSTALPTVDDVVSGNAEASPTVGGSYYLCINPSVFGQTTDVKARSDDYVSSIKQTPPRPGHSVRVPGATGYASVREESREVDVLENHRAPFFENIAGQYGLSEELLRSEFETS